MKHLKDGNAPPEIEVPVLSKKMKDNTTQWYANFIDVDEDTLQDIIIAARFLNIEDLTNLACAKLGTIIKGMTVQQFREKFKLVNDLTEEQQKEEYDEDLIQK